mgnify:CR=1 FL=1
MDYPFGKFFVLFYRFCKQLKKLIKPEKPNAYKYEAFIFDAFELTENMAIMRVKTEQELLWINLLMTVIVIAVLACLVLFTDNKLAIKTTILFSMTYLGILYLGATRIH